MTNEEINDLSPSALNEAVARKLGYVEAKPWGWTHPNKPQKGFAPEARTHPEDGLPAYSTSIEAAWEILAKLVPPGGVVSIQGPYFDGWQVVGIDVAGVEIYYPRADTAPLAICLAFLKLED